MRIVLSLVGGLVLLGALLIGGRRHRCTCPAVAALQEAGSHLVTYVPPGSSLSLRAQGARKIDIEPALALTRLGQIAIEVEQEGVQLPDEFWQALLTAAQRLEHPDWPEVIQMRLHSPSCHYFAPPTRI